MSKREVWVRKADGVVFMPHAGDIPSGFTKAFIDEEGQVAYADVLRAEPTPVDMTAVATVSRGAGSAEVNRYAASDQFAVELEEEKARLRKAAMDEIEEEKVRLQKAAMEELEKEKARLRQFDQDNRKPAPDDAHLQGKPKAAAPNKRVPARKKAANKKASSKTTVPSGAAALDIPEL